MSKSYNTKQIACMLEVDEETVRRWVRRGQLKGDLNRGKKGGFLVKESDLDEFIKEHPRYQKIVLANADNVEAYTLTNLDQRISELEELIDNLNFNLEELRRIRDRLTKITK